MGFRESENFAHCERLRACRNVSGTQIRLFQSCKSIAIGLSWGKTSYRGNLHSNLELLRIGITGRHAYRKYSRSGEKERPLSLGFLGFTIHGTLSLMHTNSGWGAEKWKIYLQKREVRWQEIILRTHTTTILADGLYVGIESSSSGNYRFGMLLGENSFFLTTLALKHALLQLGYGSLRRTTSTRDPRERIQERVYHIQGGSNKYTTLDGTIYNISIELSNVTCAMNLFCETFGTTASSLYLRSRISSDGGINSPT